MGWGGEGRTLSTFQGQAAKDISDLGKGAPDGVVRRRPRITPPPHLEDFWCWESREVLEPRSYYCLCTRDVTDLVGGSAPVMQERKPWRKREGPGAGPSGHPGRSGAGSQVREFTLPVSIICFPDWALSWDLSLFVHARPTRVSHQLPGPQAPAPRNLWGALHTSLADLNLLLSRQISHWPA